MGPVGPVGLVGLVELESLVDPVVFFGSGGSRWFCGSVRSCPNESAWLGWSVVPALTISGFFPDPKVFSHGWVNGH